MLPQIGRAALVPLWTAQLLTGTKSFERNGVIGSRRLNECGPACGAGRPGAPGRRACAGAASPGSSRPRIAQRFRPRRFCRAPRFPAAAGVRRAARPGQGVSRRAARDRRRRHGHAQDRARPAALAAMPALQAVLRSPEWRGLIRYIGSRDAEPVVWIQSILRHACRRPGRPADRCCTPTPFIRPSRPGCS